MKKMKTPKRRMKKMNKLIKINNFLSTNIGFIALAALIGFIVISLVGGTDESPDAKQSADYSDGYKDGYHNAMNDMEYMRQSASIHNE
jgi:large-conductance mechanosensitive channel